MAFRQRAGPPATPDDPEQLYRTLAGRNGAPAALWVHQGDVLRDWHAHHVDDRDVAIELPTGAGKTLVGGLIGEWRRRARRERVAYLCPTRQLAQQTAENLRSYGISTALLIGKVAGWNPAARAKYVSADAIAVSVYSHVFNSNPAIDDAQVLLLDDAHAAESYVAGPWSLNIGRDETGYQDVLTVIADALDPIVVDQLGAEYPDSQYATGVYLASPIGVAAVGAELEKVLTVAANSAGLSLDAKYALTMVRGHVDRCMIYASYRSLLIRPLIAPTGTHSPFDSPVQRVYMSATLGSGGELERSFGRTRISRIPAPRGWERQGTGRRFFCFPELTTDLSHAPLRADKWVADTIAEVGKALVLTPETRVANAFRERRIPAGFDVFEARDVEGDLDVFAKATSGVLVLTNRYDGIDLPDDACRLVILQGLPARGDLQERFLHGSLGALEVLQERLRARVAQGAGRATRNSGDYAIVIVAGGDLTRFCNRRDVLDALHPEVHAEMHFGFEESIESGSDAMTENIRAFLAQGEEWRAVDEGIAAERDALERHDPPGAVELERSAPAEVSAWLAAWQGDWEHALGFAKQAIDALRGGQAPQRYAALWNYLASCWAARLSQQIDDRTLLASSDEYMRAARAAGRGTTWLSRLAAPADLARRTVMSDESDPLDTIAATAIERSFVSIGRPRSFDENVVATRAALEGREPRAFEAAIVFLGRLAGATLSEGDRGAPAAPDARWIFEQVLWVCWEAKSDAEPGGELGAKDVRQAGGHLRFVSSELEVPIPSGSISVLVTPQERVHPAAVRVAEDHVFEARPTFVLDLFNRLVRAWRILRARGTETHSIEDVLSALTTENALPSQWLPEVMSQPVRAVREAK